MRVLVVAGVLATEARRVVRRAAAIDVLRRWREDMVVVVR